MRTDPYHRGMDCHFTIDIVDHDVIIRVSGALDQNHVLRIISSFTSHPSYRKDAGILFDVRETNYHPQYQEVFSFLTEYRVRFRPLITGKLAFLVRTGVQYGIARMSSTLLSSCLPDTEVFLSEDDAAAWLRS